MELDNYHFTNRANRILQLAVEYEDGIICPHHLFMAACRESTGVCREMHLYLQSQLGPDYLRQFEKHHQGSGDIQIIFEKADEKRKYYRQTLINEGHLIESIVEIDNVVNDMLTKEMKEAIIQIACVPRDMIVQLAAVKKKEDLSYKNSIRRAVYADMPELKRFIQAEFGDRWIKRIDHLQTRGQLPVFLAEEGGEIIGFACFDMEKKGMFGPMGTSRRKRLSSAGKELLHRSLLDMAERGYAYAVIEQAGPIEFYEKTVGAKLI